MRLAGPVEFDVTPLQAAFGPGGQAAVGFGFVDPDRPGGATASVALIPGAGKPARARRVPHARQVLDVAYLGGTLQILSGTSGGGLACCTRIQTLALGTRGFSAPHSLIQGLAGVSTGQLLASGTGSLALFASSTGVWAARAGRDGRYGATHRLTAAGTSPQSLLAMTLHGGGPLVAFTEVPLQPASADPGPTVMVSRGHAAGLPPTPQPAQIFPAETDLGALALAANPSAPVLGWVADTGDGTGANQSEVALATVGSSPMRPRTFTMPGQTESGLAGAADNSGDELFAWQSCDAVPVCHVLAVSRPRHGRFGSARPLSTIDAGTQPAVAVGANGAAAVAWVQGGRIYVTRRVSWNRRFSTPVRLIGAGPASNLSLIAGPSGRLLAVWAAGTQRTTVWASELR